MARRTLNRRELRDAAEQADSPGTKKVAKKKAVKKKASTTSRSRTKKAAAPVGGLKLVWGVFDASNESVKTFQYRDRKKADKLAADLTAKHGSTHFVKPVKEPMA